MDKKVVVLHYFYKNIVIKNIVR
jgi:hypothetical protein